MPPPVTVIAQCSHSTLQSLHNAITPPHLHPAAAHHRTLYPLRSPPPNPAHSVITPPRIPSCALAVLPRGKRKPSAVHTTAHPVPPAPLPAPPRQLSNFPTSQQIDKPESRQVGKRPRLSRLIPPHPAAPLTIPNNHRPRSPVVVTAQCSHSTLLSLHPALAPPARARRPFLAYPRVNRRFPLPPARTSSTSSTGDPPRNAAKPPPPCSTASWPATIQHQPPPARSPPDLTPPRSPYAAGKPPPPGAHPPLPYRSSSSHPRTATSTSRGDPPTHRPLTRSAAKPPHLLACDHPTTHQPHHRCARLTPGVNPQTRRLPPHLCYPARERSPPPPALPGLRPPSTNPQHQPPLALAAFTLKLAHCRNVVSSSHPRCAVLPPGRQNPASAPTSLHQQ